MNDQWNDMSEQRTDMRESLPPCQLDWTRHSLFLDFDGTLAPIVDQPADAMPGAETLHAIGRIAAMADNAVAVLSGRAMADVALRLKPLTLAISGSHGHEIWLPGDAPCAGTTSQTEGAMPDTIVAEVTAFADAHGLMLEPKPGSLALHYRLAPHKADAARALVDDIAGRDGSFRPLHGQMVSEVALAAVSKGTALRAFTRTEPFRGRLPVMAGDDTTDEDGIVAAQSLGGFGIRIGPGPSAARYRVASIDDFLEWLAAEAGVEQTSG